MKADYVSLKVDSVREDTWRLVNRPHGILQLDSILDGALDFARGFKGELATETMLVEGVNDRIEYLGEVADFLARLQPDVAYLSIPTRPPAEKWVRAPCEASINRAYQILSGRLGQAHPETGVLPRSARVEYLIGYEGNAFAFTGEAEEDLLSITAVHPMREEAVSDFLARAGADWAIVRELAKQGEIVETDYAGQRFYMRKTH
jgi:wyosine [tRNA(Phe)-imidazoG37] synthetase (radical SAM superfamily)